MMANYGDRMGQTREVISVTNNPVTISRVLNVVLMALFFIAIILHVVCLGVMVAKHNELVDKFAQDDPNIKKSCILFLDYDSESGTAKWVNNRCDIVIYGSGALGVCALLMIIVLMIRSLLFTRVNSFVILDGIEVLLTGLCAGALAIIVTLGKNETCESIEKVSSDAGYPVSCEDFYITDFNNNRKAKVYEALLTAQYTSWLAVGVLGVIGLLTLIRMLLWVISIQRHRGIATLNPSLVEHDQLGMHNNMRNVLSSSYNDDVQPLSP